MAKSRQRLSNQDSSLSPTAARSREWDGPSRWADYLGTDTASPLSSTSSRNFTHDGQSQGTTPSQPQKGLNMQWVVQLTDVAEGLMAKMYRLNQLLDYPDPINHVFSDGFWKAGVFPNHPRICVLLSKKFPEHFSKLQLERIDKIAWDSMQDHAELHLQSLEPWVQVLF
ncbi:protein NAP1-like [Trifolium medium]|uniref:NAP1 n=2 Tax=Trifolium TaxID=3898 RepID=A0A2K3NLQ8_TRIPR|nr:protein NAP1-like [Trifolium medium]PNY03965.1 NAP1 [Trifolium pratense]